jgi:hypothetical protein
MNHTARLAALSDENGDLTRAPCPSCRASTSDVTDSRAWHGQVKRRRKCRACQHRWSTLEVPFDVTNTREFHLMETKLRRLAAEATEMADALRGLAELVPTKGEG